jgi:hypothetical protein
MVFFVADPALEIKAEHLSRHILMPVKKVNDVCFMHIDKKDCKLQRLFCAGADVKSGGSGSRAKQLARTTIFETIRSIRDKEFWRRLNVPEACQKKFLHTRKRANRTQLLILEETIFAAELPAFGEIEPKAVLVLLTKPWGDCLMVECTPESLGHITDICTWEATTNEPKLEPRLRRPEADRFQNDGTRGLSFSYSAGKPVVVAKRKREDGKYTRKYIKVEGGDVEKAREEGKKFINGDISDDDRSTGDNAGPALETCSDRQSDDEAAATVDDQVKSIRA